MAKKKIKAAWERAYKSHVLWMGKAKIGKVFLVSPASYKWEAAGRMGESDSLDKAKAAVEYAVAISDKQLQLFD